ncbi:GNAT family N-acetyltransferase [Streptacidiphilus sp. N1-3]|uniref:GNAT family N-acetyltransferase n=1 Tax=Streptacidiphilus alkalitolerans TaxID=3342712 RepID=A0ABV6WVZ0_9ACTN
MGDSLSVRQIEEQDWEDIVLLESRAYAPLGLSEERAALESRAEASPTTCFVLARGPAVAGYLLALPYPRFRYPGLGRPERAGFQSDNLHLHDLVVADQWRGQGFAGLLLGRLLAVARERRHAHLSLVAVGGSGAFWSRRGFRSHHEVDPPRHYGDDAVYMSRPVGDPPHGPATHHRGD